MAEAKVKEQPKFNGVDKQPKELPIVRRDTLKLRETVRNEFFVHAPHGLKVADVLKPSVWSTVAGVLKPFDSLWVAFAEEHRLCELVVRNSAPGCCAMVMLRQVDIGPMVEFGEGDIPNHRIYRDAKDGWCVERTNPDGSTIVMAKGVEHGNWDRRGARDWLETHPSVRQKVPSGQYAH